MVIAVCRECDLETPVGADGRFVTHGHVLTGECPGSGGEPGKWCVCRRPEPDDSLVCWRCDKPVDLEQTTRDEGGLVNVVWRPRL